jgi:hypothetical protein
MPQLRATRRITAAVALSFLSVLSLGGLGSRAYAAAPPNNGFGHATRVSTFPQDFDVDTRAATNQTLDPGPSCGRAVNGSVWYRVQLPADAEILVDTLGSRFETVLAAYTGGSLADLREVACGHNDFFALAEIRFIATAGVNYYVELGGYGAQGLAHIHFAKTDLLAGEADFAFRPIDTQMDGPGCECDLAVDIERATGFDGPVDLTVEGLPPGATAAFDPPTITGDGSTLSLFLGPTVAGGIYRAVVHGTSATTTREAELRIVIDAVSPTVTTPSVGFNTDTVTQLPLTGAIPAVASWWSNDDNFWAAQQTVMLSVNNGPFSTARGTYPRDDNGFGIDVDMTPGASYQYRVYATDSVGHDSRTALSERYIGAVYDQDSPAITFSGGWKTLGSASDYGGSRMQTTRIGAVVQVNFVGSSVAIVTPFMPGGGKAKVFIDGVKQGVITVRGDSYEPRLVAFSRYLGQGGHVLKIVTIGAPGKDKFALDAVIVLGQASASGTCDPSYPGLCIRSAHSAPRACARESEWRR